MKSVGFVFLFFLIGGCSLLSAQSRKPIRIKLKSVPELSLIKNIGDNVVIRASVENISSSPQQLTLKWKYNTVAFDVGDAPKPVTFALEPGKGRAFEISFVQQSEGLVETQCEVTGATGFSVKAKRRVGIPPKSVISPINRPSDFDAFWQQSLDELSKVDPQFQAIRDRKLSNQSFDVFEVSMKSLAGVTVRGWLEIPLQLKSDNKSPVMIRVPGYGGRVNPTGNWNRWVVFSFNPRGHGNSQDEVSGLPANYWLRGLDSKEEYFYRGAYMDCIRAVDYLASLARIDQDRMAIVGTSQGGGLAMVTAALDNRIDFCAPDIPFLCDWENYFKLSHWPDMIRWVDEKPGRTWKSTLHTLSYFDALNFADRISCPVFMGIGLQDTICPPTTNFSVYHQIKGPKEYRIYPDRGHGLGREHRIAVEGWLMGNFFQLQ